MVELAQPLFRALHNCNTNAVNILLDFGVKATSVGSKTRQPIINAAAADGNFDVTEILVSRGADVNSYYGCSVLQETVISISVSCN